MASERSHGKARPTLPRASGRSPYGLAVDNSNLYWSDYSSGSVMTCPKDACTAPVTLAAVNQPLGLVIDSANVYWGTASGSIMRCGVGGCGGAPTTIATGQGLPSRMAIDATRLYWTNGASGSAAVMSLAK